MLALSESPVRDKLKMFLQKYGPVVTLALGIEHLALETDW